MIRYTNPKDFEWQLPVNGFVVREGWLVEPCEASKAPVRFAAARPGPSQATYPLEARDLYLRFTRVRDEEDAIRFLNEFGTVKGSGFLRGENDNRFNVGTQRDVRGELVDGVIREATILRACVELWGAISSGDTGAVKKWVRKDERDALKDPAGWKTKPAGKGAVGKSRTFEGWVFDIVAAADAHVFAEKTPYDWRELAEPYPIGARGGLKASASLTEVARAALSELVNHALDGKTSASLVDEGPRGAGLRIQLTPRNLLSAMWLQLAQVVEGAVKFRKCAVCGCKMPLSGRKDRVTCSGACRVRRAREVK